MLDTIQPNKGITGIPEEEMNKAKSLSYLVPFLVQLHLVVVVGAYIEEWDKEQELKDMEEWMDMDNRCQWQINNSCQWQIIIDFDIFYFYSIQMDFAIIY